MKVVWGLSRLGMKGRKLRHVTAVGLTRWIPGKSCWPSSRILLQFPIPVFSLLGMSFFGIEKLFYIQGFLFAEWRRNFRCKDGTVRNIGYAEI